MNRGTGAGGANTNLYGCRFENATNNQSRLVRDFGFTVECIGTKTKRTATPNLNKPATYCLKRTFSSHTMTFVMQAGLKKYMKHVYGHIPRHYEVDELFRRPDEAYIVERPSEHRRPILYILEKKEQNVEGSVETKLWSAPALKREYELVLGEAFDVRYALCVSEFLKQRMAGANTGKYGVLNDILREANITVLFGDDPDYFEMLDAWLDHAMSK